MTIMDATPLIVVLGARAGARRGSRGALRLAAGKRALARLVRAA